MIYFFDIKRLAAELRDDLVPEINKLYYYMIMTIWMLIATSRIYTDWMYEQPTRLERIGDFATFVIVIVGTLSCYDMNKDGDNKDFIARITCLGLPAWVRMMIVVAVVAFAGIFVNEVLALELPQSTLFFFANLVGLPYMYHQLYQAFGIAAYPAIGQSTVS